MVLAGLVLTGGGAHATLKRTWLAALALTLVLAACGGGSGGLVVPGPDVPAGPETPDDGSCAVTLPKDITVATLLPDTPAACDYLVPRTGDLGGGVFVSNGALTVEPGVVIRFEQDTTLNLGDNASLQAVGTPEARIRFEGAANVKGYGKGVFLGPGSLESRIAYADFINLGKEAIGPYAFHNAAISGLQGGGLRLTDTVVAGSSFFGAELDDLPLLEFRRNAFYANARAGVSVTAPQVALLDAETDYAGMQGPNGEPYIFVAGLEPLVENTTWEPRNAPYFIDGALYVEGSTFTPTPGTVFVFGEGSGLVVSEGGTLSSVGTAQYPVIFTGTAEVPGVWDGLVFTGASPNSRLEYTGVAYGGGGTIYEGSVTVAYQDALYVANSAVVGSAGYGICADPYAALTQGPGNVFQNNALGDVNTACD